jgi:Bacterial HORMA domain family 1
MLADDPRTNVQRLSNVTSSFTTTDTFTRTHAKRLAAKVVADLYQCYVLYDKPLVSHITEYEAELIELLAGEYVAEYEFGFKNGGQRVLSWRYTVGPDGGLHSDSNAGSLFARADVVDAAYYNFLTYSTKWFSLSTTARATIKGALPLQRGDGSLPGDGAGYWQTDHGYTAGGTLVARRTFRPW